MRFATIPFIFLFLPADEDPVLALTSISAGGGRGATAAAWRSSGGTGSSPWRRAPEAGP